MPWQDLIMKVSPSEKERGVGLVVVVLAAALVSAIVATSTSMIHNKTKERVLEARKAERLAAYEFVKASLADPSSLRVSASRDAILRNCIGLNRNSSGRPRVSLGCVGGTVNPLRPVKRAFQLRVPFSRALPSEPIGAVSDTDTAGRFDKRGQLMSRGCATFSANCPYQVRTYYWAQCPNNAARCDEAVRIFTLAQIRQRADVAQGTKGFIFPTANVFNNSPYKESSFTLTSDIAESLYMTCPEGSSLIGTTNIVNPGQPNGPPLNLAKCACSQGYMLDKSKGNRGYDTATGWPYCTMQLCNASRGEVLSEIDANGEIKCEVPNANAYQCSDFRTPSTGVVNCPSGYKMRGLQSGDDCLIKDRPGIGEHVDCDQMVIKCCKKI